VEAPVNVSIPGLEDSGNSKVENTGLTITAENCNDKLDKTRRDPVDGYASACCNLDL